MIHFFPIPQLLIPFTCFLGFLRLHELCGRFSTIKTIIISEPNCSFANNLSFLFHFNLFLWRYSSLHIHTFSFKPLYQVIGSCLRKSKLTLPICADRNFLFSLGQLQSLGVTYLKHMLTHHHSLIMRCPSFSSKTNQPTQDDSFSQIH